MKTVPGGAGRRVTIRDERKRKTVEREERKNYQNEYRPGWFGWGESGKQLSGISGEALWCRCGRPWGCFQSVGLP